MRGERAPVVRWLFAPVDNAPLVLFRVLLGALLALETGGSIATGWVRENLIEPRVDFPMVGFEWLRPLPGWGEYAHYALMALCGVLVALGLFYRAAMLAFAIGWTAAYAMQTVSYNNHYWLIVLLAWLMLALPAHAGLSLDSRRRPELASATCPRWCLAALRAQIAVVYAFAALAKLDADWLAGRPLEIWMASRSERALGPFLTQPWLPKTLAWGGLFFDAAIVPLLAWRRTRLLALALAAAFHLFNSYVFRIGVFPYLGIAACVLFFPGEELRRRFLRREPAPPARAEPVPEPTPRRRAAALALGAWFALQLLLPLRHYLFPGNVHWTEEGHRMSWRMMLRTKSGTIVFQLHHPPSGKRWVVRPREFLTPKQCERVAIRPELAWQFAQFLERHYAAEGLAPVEVRASSIATLNGRRAQPLVDPDVDLAAAEWDLFAPTPWIVPLREDALGAAAAEESR